MKRISKTLSSVLLAAAIAVSSVQASEMTSVTANAAYTNDLSITGYAALDLTPDEYTEVDFTFSGEGIAAVRRESSGNLSVYTKEIIWSAYPERTVLHTVLNGGTAETATGRTMVLTVLILQRNSFTQADCLQTASSSPAQELPRALTT